VAAAPLGSAEASAEQELAELELHHVTLLQPDPVIEQRVTDQSELAASLKHVPALVSSYDEGHRGVLPEVLDVLLVVRPNGLRVWLVGAAGDISNPDLERALAGIPRFGVKASNIAVVLTFVRVGVKENDRDPYLPSSWKAAAGSGTAIDDVIDQVWPP
jgi:hypothetical protein